MRREKRWRYYCDHCKKSGGSAYHLKRHEERCTANPDRKCGICDNIGDSPRPIKELIIAIGSGGEQGLERVRDISINCPACILAAIRQSGINDKGAEQFIEYDFHKELASFWSDYNEGQETYEH